MNELVTYSAGFSHEIGWEWPIAVYLLLAGISGGAIAIAFLIRFYKKQSNNTSIYKGAALISCATILLGMICLVADLTRPLLFWKILINYNWSSVMSIGVMALLFYIPLTCVLVLFAFEKEIKQYFSFLSPIIDILLNFRLSIEKVAFVLSVVICAYTGFLISVLVRFPLLNTSILPALFVVSGFSAGTAALSIVSKAFFSKDMDKEGMNILHKIEWPIMSAEILFLFMLYVSLLSGNEANKIAVFGFYTGTWSFVFWIGVVFIGFVLPIIMNFLLGKKIAHSIFVFYTSAICSIIGVLFLRLFILYAGQIFSL